MAYAWHAPDRIDEAVPLDVSQIKAPLTPQGLVKAWAESTKPVEDVEAA